MALINFTLSNARRFYSSMGKPLGWKGLIPSAKCKHRKRMDGLELHHHAPELIIILIIVTSHCPPPHNFNQQGRNFSAYILAVYFNWLLQRNWKKQLLKVPEKLKLSEHNYNKCLIMLKIVLNELVHS